MNAKVVKLTSGGAGSGAWSGSVSTDCGEVDISINCRTCCPSLGDPTEATVTATFAAETLSVGPCLCIDGFSVTMTWDENRQGMFGQGLSPCGDTVSVFLDLVACKFYVSSDRYSITNLGTTLDSCGPFHMHQHCQQVSATTTAFVVTLTAPGWGDAGTGTGASCKGYYLTLSCGGETKTVFPDSCSCDPFSLEFPPITLTSCCDGTVVIVVSDTCCDDSSLTCCCDTVPVSWAVSAGGFVDGTDCGCSALNGDMTLPIDISSPCAWRSAAVGTCTDRNNSLTDLQWYLHYSVVGPSWILQVLIQRSITIAQGVIPAALFNCLGENTFDMMQTGDDCLADPCCAVVPAAVTLSPA